MKDFVQQTGPSVTPEIAGTAAVELVREDAATIAPAYLLTDGGLKKLA